MKFQIVRSEKKGVGMGWVGEGGVEEKKKEKDERKRQRRPLITFNVDAYCI